MPALGHGQGICHRNPLLVRLTISLLDHRPILRRLRRLPLDPFYRILCRLLRRLRPSSSSITACKELHEQHRQRRQVHAIKQDGERLAGGVCAVDGLPLQFVAGLGEGGRGGCGGRMYGIDAKGVAGGVGGVFGKGLGAGGAEEELAGPGKEAGWGG